MGNTGCSTKIKILKNTLNTSYLTIRSLIELKFELCFMWFISFLIIIENVFGGQDQ